jgi:hypothetical protein
MRRVICTATGVMVSGMGLAPRPGLLGLELLGLYVRVEQALEVIREAAAISLGQPLELDLKLGPNAETYLRVTHGMLSNCYCLLSNAMQR